MWHVARAPSRLGCVRVQIASRTSMIDTMEPVLHSRKCPECMDCDFRRSGRGDNDRQVCETVTRRH